MGEKELNVSPGNKNKRQLISSRDTRQITTLGCDGDKNWLSSFLCFVRSDCVEVFVATNDDIAYRRNSRKIKLGQVGIRCRFCVYLSHQQRSGRSCSFPSGGTDICRGCLRHRYVRLTYVQPLCLVY